MLYILWTAFRPAPREQRLLRGAFACAFLALLINGIVEYNFGNSVVLMLYLTLIGLIHAVSSPTPAAARAPAPPPNAPAICGQSTAGN